jgi:hypothetical protein
MEDYRKIQWQIDQLTNTTQEERHGKQFREQQACERRLKQMQIKRNKAEKRKQLNVPEKG